MGNLPMESRTRDGSVVRDRYGKIEAIFLSERHPSRQSDSYMSGVPLIRVSTRFMGW